MKITRFKTLDSTNQYLQNLLNEGADIADSIIVTDFQTSGKGQGKNVWQSEDGKNLLFSVALDMSFLKAENQFLLTQMVSVAMINVLKKYLPEESLFIKWPNDIYWHGHKMGGILIECTLSGGMVKDCIMGVGINVNQEEFTNLEKHPLSLIHIVHRKTNREVLLHDIIHNLHDYLCRIEHKQYDFILAEYEQSLYRGRGYHQYRDINGTFMARFISIDPTGHINLRDDDGMLRTYACKEVEFLDE